MKRSLIFGLIAVLSAGLLFVGCSQATDPNEPSSTTPDGLVIDQTVTNTADLKAALDKPDVRVILFDIGGSARILTPDTYIPKEKTVYLVNSGSVGVDAQGKPNNTVSPTAAGSDAGIGNGLIVSGRLVVGKGVVLSAAENAPIRAWIGRIEVQDDGALSVEKRISINNRTDNDVASFASVLGNSSIVSIEAGGALEIRAEQLTTDEINTLLGYLAPGKENALMAGYTGESTLKLGTDPSFTFQYKPSAFTEFSVPANRVLDVTTGIIETEAALTVPAQITIRPGLGDTFQNVTALTVQKGGSVIGNVVGKTAGIVLTVAEGGTLETSGTIAAIAPDSSIAGRFTGYIGSYLANARIAITAGAVINDQAYPKGGVLNLPVLPPTSGAVVVEKVEAAAGDDVVIPPLSNISASAVTAPEGSSITIAKGAEVTAAPKDKEAVTVTLAGTVELAGKLTISDGANAEISGTVSIPSGGELVLIKGDSGITGNLTGVITLENGGTYRDQSVDGSLWVKVEGDTPSTSTGSIVFAAGSEAYIGDGEGVYFIGPITSEDDGAALQLATGATLTSKVDGFTLTGSALVTDPTVDVPEGFSLTITKESIATIAAGVAFEADGTITLAGELRGQPGTEDSKSEIKVGAKGGITISGTGVNNFYASKDATTPIAAIEKSTEWKWEAREGNNGYGWIKQEKKG
jgi:hypothetical protein